MRSCMYIGKTVALLLLRLDCRWIHLTLVHPLWHVQRKSLATAAWIDYQNQTQRKLFFAYSITHISRSVSRMSAWLMRPSNGWNTLTLALRGGWRESYNDRRPHWSKRVKVLEVCPDIPAACPNYNTLLCYADPYSIISMPWLPFAQTPPSQRSGYNTTSRPTQWRSRLACETTNHSTVRVISSAVWSMWHS